MRGVVKFILNQKEIDRVLHVRNVNAKSIIGFLLESNTYERIAIELKENDGKYKRGKGSQKQMAVLVMAESKIVEASQKYKYKPINKIINTG